MANNIDKLFNEEDIEELNQIQMLRKNLLKNIGLPRFIEIIKSLIDQSEDYEFTSASKRKFISLNTPIFVIRRKNFEYNPAIGSDDEQINAITKEITHEILDKTTEAILIVISNDEQLKELYGNISETIKGLLWTTIFEIRVSLKDNIIYMRYCI